MATFRSIPKETDDSWYTKGGIEPIDFIASQNMGYREGRIVMYVTRYLHKNGLEDLKKARFHLNHLIDEMEAEQKGRPVIEQSEGVCSNPHLDPVQIRSFEEE
ncbi:MAG: DUF3310 domain-containing protein [Deltaproteobacteria bacterium]|nr:DUF3310 domain-containing protein [Candidatus Zymogenaceae bacterium]